jgi:hypothetical protein
MQAAHIAGAATCSQVTSALWERLPGAACGGRQLRLRTTVNSARLHAAACSAGHPCVRANRISPTCIETTQRTREAHCIFLVAPLRCAPLPLLGSLAGPCWLLPTWHLAAVLQSLAARRAGGGGGGGPRVWLGGRPRWAGQTCSACLPHSGPAAAATARAPCGRGRQHCCQVGGVQRPARDCQAAPAAPARLAHTLAPAGARCPAAPGATNRPPLSAPFQQPHDVLPFSLSHPATCRRPRWRRRGRRAARGPQRQI